MDPIDSFFQQLDSEQLLKAHGPSLVRDAREVLARNPDVRVAGLIVTQDSPDAGPLRAMHAKDRGGMPPAGPMVHLVARSLVEGVLTRTLGTESWMEQGWQRQQVLPVVVSTRDGHRFGFFGLDESSGRPAQM